MDSKLKIGRKVPDKNDMQSLEGREREREKKKMKGAHSMYALDHNDACSVKVNKVDLKVCPEVDVVVKMAKLR